MGPPAYGDGYLARTRSHAIAEQMEVVVLPGGPLGVHDPMHMPSRRRFADARDVSAGRSSRLPVQHRNGRKKKLLIVNWQRRQFGFPVHAAETPAHGSRDERGDCPGLLRGRGTLGAKLQRADPCRGDRGAAVCPITSTSCI